MAQWPRVLETGWYIRRSPVSGAAAAYSKVRRSCPTGFQREAARGPAPRASPSRMRPRRPHQPRALRSRVSHRCRARRAHRPPRARFACRSRLSPGPRAKGPPAAAPAGPRTPGCRPVRARDRQLPARGRARRRELVLVRREGRLESSFSWRATSLASAPRRRLSSRCSRIASSSNPMSPRNHTALAVPRYPSTLLQPAPPVAGRAMRGYSSDGRAPGSHPGGRGFESPLAPLFAPPRG